MTSPTAADPPTNKWSTIGFLADVVLSFLFLCLVSELPNAIFFPALVAMGFSGLEVMLGIEIFTLILGISFIWNVSFRFQGFLLLASLYSFYTYYTTKDHLIRGYGIGFSIVFLRFVVHSVLTSTKSRASRLSWAWATGLMILICLRYANKSASPVWSFEGSEKLPCALGFFAALYLIGENSGRVPEIVLTEPSGYFHWVLPSLAYGSLQFLTVWLFSNYNVVCRWVNVNPTFYGPGIIVAMFLGFWLSQHRSLVTSIFWFSFAVLSGSLLYYGEPLPGYFGGVGLALFCCSSWPYVFYSLFQNSALKGRFFLLGQLTFIFLEFTTVWNIAYMFLDLGDAFRESPHYPLFFSIFAIGLHNISFTDSLDEEGGKSNKDTQKNIKVKSTFESLNFRGVSSLSLAFCCFFLPVLYIRSTPALTISNPHKVEDVKDVLKVMVWNVHTGYDDYGFDNYDLGTKFIQDMKAGVVAILESDQARIVTGNRDEIEYIGASLGFPYHNYGVQTRESTWGCALLSLYPIVKSNVTILPSPKGTKSCLIDAELEVNNKLFGVIVSHFSTEEFPEDLRLQSIELANLAKTKTLPTVVLAYITSSPTSDTRRKTLKKPFASRSYETITRLGELQDPDPSDFDRWCQYIFFKNTQCKSFYHVDTGYMSDTEALLADVYLESQCKDGDEDCAEAKSLKAGWKKYNINERSVSEKSAPILRN